MSQYLSTLGYHVACKVHSRYHAIGEELEIREANNFKFECFPLKVYLYPLNYSFLIVKMILLYVNEVKE